ADADTQGGGLTVSSSAPVVDRMSHIKAVGICGGCAFKRPASLQRWHFARCAALAGPSSECLQRPTPYEPTRVESRMISWCETRCSRVGAFGLVIRSTRAFTAVVAISA